MSLYGLTIIAVALSLDAFGVALCVGLNGGLRFRNKLLFAFSFGLFQFLFSIIGAYAGYYFNTYIVSIPKVVGGIIIAIVGVLMIREGIGDKEQNIFLDPKMYVVLGVSVSIDAIVIGFTALNNIQSNLVILNNTLYIGVVTFIISCIGFFIAKYLKKIQVVEKYADYLGGIILILFGLKMIFF